MPAQVDKEALGRPVTSLHGVGERQAERLGQLGVATVRDLLLHLPLRYEDRSRVRRLGELRPGMQALTAGTVELTEIVQGRRSRLVCRLTDGTGALTLVFFHYHPSQQQRLARGTRVRCFGEVREGPGGLQMVHPEIERDSAGDDAGDGLLPVYPTTQGLNQTALRRLVDRALALLAASPPEELLPGDLRETLGVPGFAEAVTTLHRPPADGDPVHLMASDHPARRRLVIEELLAHHLTLRRQRHALRERAAAPVLRGTGRLVAAFMDSLAFALTAAQERVNRETAEDMARRAPMLRLVQGDVGSGKTVIAALAALRCVETGFQAAIMAPTELLAEQHFRNFRDWLEPLGVTVTWLSGRLAAGQRREALQALADGQTGVVVGTHALFQEEVQFHRLGLVVVDEQHRFGVHQRLALREKGQTGTAQPHQLIMTATPIPRTLAMTAYADLDVSVIDELPPGRSPVTTVAVPDSRRDEVVAGVDKACREGRQAYWVCTLVEESDALQAQAAEETAGQLREALADRRIGLVHGRLRAAEKDAAMQAFARGELDVLVATTVIEVGVDVPNASLMVIENPERLGLAQLHQLRGRVGRGAAASSCVLLYHAPLTDTARARLAVLRQSGDGFEIARRDLEIRGPGELLGTRQTGAWQLRVADLVRDGELIPRVQGAADRLLREAPDRADALIQRWVGEAARYGQV
ncbi:ATP-dependent DNA helicase RecG [Aquisalimonas lutea]|uniref:ATP-dependent DNA helicase RecG n=1 Tax=Aquisalimonas lutea TaxID=1327750 RepID=UPI0025B3ECB4|nr:ATP-dependent DNA helicase RecG [Aquisalimonas lutea]MDN3516919.1 ATP-dependent DNA helicase RecG [Aquisalimonas lutea]